MIYIKPPNLSYTDMAIWIDTNYTLPTCDDAKLYEYLYHLLFMIAQKNKYFRYTHQYEDYALQGASKLFMRLKDPRQFDSDAKLPVIKSILNYIKTVCYPYKVDFEQSSYVETDENNLIIHSDNFSICNYIAEESDIFELIEFKESLSDIPGIIKSYINQLTHLKNRSDIKNIYISCILTFMDCINITANEAKEILKDKTSINNHLDKLYAKNMHLEPLLSLTSFNE